MRDNRVRTNRLLSSALAGCQIKPRVLVCASGQGIYAPAGDKALTEAGPPGHRLPGQHAARLRSLIASAAPGVTETMHRRGFTYYDAGRGGPVSASICQIIFQPDHIRLAFIHGKFFPDPKRLLEGKEKYKRYVRLNSYGRAPWDDLRDLIYAASRFDPYTRTMR